MAHHLYVLQALTLGMLEPRMRTPLDPYSQVQGVQRLESYLEFCFESMIFDMPLSINFRSSGTSCRPCARQPLSQRGSPWAQG